ncbi:MAG: aliphatic sulfonate ABC transporter substrate-binding protein [Candidatus Adiutrix sp.]|jgi:sulfonate transport system substrate-binding protein|nr:aliphatic sulfonate ABC transporter substrate-binding protein [Candidatus Adiutrix sp.]
MIKKILAAAVYALSAALIANVAQAETLKLRIATQPSPFASALFLSKEKGILEKTLKTKGLDVDIKWTSFPAGPPMNEAFAAGEEDLGLVGDVPALLNKSSGQKTIIFGKTSSGPETLALVVKPDSPLKTAADLKGKKVAFVKGSYGHHLLGLILTQGGLTFDDIKIVNLPNADVNAAVADNQVDAGLVWEPALINGLERGQVKVLIDGTGIKNNNIYYFILEDYAKAHPQVTAAFLEAQREATQFIADHPEEAAKAIVNDVKLPEPQLIKLFKKYNYSPELTDQDVAELKIVEEFNFKAGLSKTRVDVDNYVRRQTGGEAKP